MLPWRFSRCNHLLRRCSANHGGYRDACPPLLPIKLTSGLSPLPLPRFPPSALSVASCHSPSFPEYASVSNLPSENTVLCRNERPLARFPPKLSSNPLLHRNSLAAPWPSWTSHPPDAPISPLSLSGLVAGSEPILSSSSPRTSHLLGAGLRAGQPRGDWGQRHSSETPSAAVNGRLSG